LEEDIVKEDIGLSVGAAQITNQDRLMWRKLRVDGRAFPLAELTAHQLG